MLTLLCVLSVTTYLVCMAHAVWDSMRAPSKTYEVEVYGPPKGKGRAAGFRPLNALKGVMRKILAWDIHTLTRGHRPDTVQKH
jgi:hypothetical protein